MSENEKQLHGSEIGHLIEKAIEQGLQFQVNIHGVELETAIVFAENILGPDNHRQVTINRQPSCFVVGVERGKGAVDFFVNKGGA